MVARAALVNTLLDMGAAEDAMSVIEDGLRRNSEPRMVRLAVEAMVSAGRIAEADTALTAHRPGLGEYGATDLGFRLGELVAAAKLASAAPPEGDRRAAEGEWPWITQLDGPIRRWLIGAHRSASNLKDLRIAFAMYTAKIAEKLIVERILTPFRDAQTKPEFLADSAFRDVTQFLQGKKAPSIGGFVRLLRAASQPFRSSDSRLVAEFRTFLQKLTWPGAALLTEASLVQSLGHMAGVRNESAHLEEPTQDAVVSASSLIVRDDKPGPLFEAVGLTLSIRAHDDPAEVLRKAHLSARTTESLERIGETP